MLPQDAASSDTQSGCKTFPRRFDVRNLSWPVSSGSESLEIGQSLALGVQFIVAIALFLT